MKNPFSYPLDARHSRHSEMSTSWAIDPDIGNTRGCSPEDWTSRKWLLMQINVFGTSSNMVMTVTHGFSDLERGRMNMSQFFLTLLSTQLISGGYKVNSGPSLYYSYPIYSCHNLVAAYGCDIGAESTIAIVKWFTNHNKVQMECRECLLIGRRRDGGKERRIVLACTKYSSWVFLENRIGRTVILSSPDTLSQSKTPANHQSNDSFHRLVLSRCKRDQENRREKKKSK